MTRFVDKMEEVRDHTKVFDKRTWKEVSSSKMEKIKGEAIFGGRSRSLLLHTFSIRFPKKKQLKQGTACRLNFGK